MPYSPTWVSLLKGERKPQTPQLSLQVWAIKPKEDKEEHRPKRAHAGQLKCSSIQP